MCVCFTNCVDGNIGSDDSTCQRSYRSSHETKPNLWTPCIFSFNSVHIKRERFIYSRLFCLCWYFVLRWSDMCVICSLGRPMNASSTNQIKKKKLEILNKFPWFTQATHTSNPWPFYMSNFGHTSNKTPRTQ